IFEKLRGKYISYIQTDFWALDEGFKEAREKLLKETPAIVQEPWFEIIRKYPASKKKIKDLTLTDVQDFEGNNYFTKEELEFFKRLTSAGLFGDYTIYKHQLEMLQNYARGKNCIITTGTGSG